MMVVSVSPLSRTAPQARVKPTQAPQAAPTQGAGSIADRMRAAEERRKALAAAIAQQPTAMAEKPANPTASAQMQKPQTQPAEKPSQTQIPDRQTFGRTWKDRAKEQGVTGRKRENRALREPKLTEPELRLLTIAIDPANWGMSPDDMAKAAGLTPAQMGRVKRSAAWQSALQEVMLRRCGERVPAIFDAMLASACLVGPPGVRDRHKLLEAMGFLPSKYGASPLFQSFQLGGTQNTIAARMAKATDPAYRRKLLEQAQDDPPIIDADAEEIEEEAG